MWKFKLFEFMKIIIVVYYEDINCSFIHRIKQSEIKRF